MCGVCLLKQCAFGLSKQAPTVVDASPMLFGLVLVKHALEHSKLGCMAAYFFRMAVGQRAIFACSEA